MSNRDTYNKSEWIGKKFGMLTVIEPVHKVHPNGNSQWYWRTVCDCGKIKEVHPYTVIAGKVVSCGCYRTMKPCPTKTHGESHTRLHDIWCGINRRCNPENKHSERYGKRGITICEEWGNYESFAEWARNNGYEDGLTIERIDVNGNYCPDNCAWIPFKKQARNRRTTHWVEYDGRKMSLAEACELANLPYKQVFERIKKRHWSVDEALSVPMHFRQLGYQRTRKRTSKTG